MLIRFLVCGGMTAARLLELAHSRRNLAEQVDVEEGAWSQRTFPLMVALHAAVIGGTLASGGRPRTGWLAGLLLLQPLRIWILITLGRRWSARGAVARNVAVVTSGPYRYVRHPNYAVVLGELLCLPLAFGLRGLAFLGLVANAALLAVRISDEERLLMRQPGYANHFRDKRRLVPGLI
jgi:methyltransferase